MEKGKVLEKVWLENQGGVLCRHEKHRDRDPGEGQACSGTVPAHYHRDMGTETHLGMKSLCKADA